MFIDDGNKKKVRKEEVDIFPLGDEEKSCFFCNKEFEKRFVAKFKCWCYSEVAVTDRGDKDLIHTACLKELRKQGQLGGKEIKLLKKKRMVGS